MKLRNPWVLCLLGLLGAWLIRLWMRTLRYRLFFVDGIRHPADSRNHRCIYAFWHESILFPTGFRARIHVLISRHADGELIAQVSRFLVVQPVRPSPTPARRFAPLDLL